MGEEGAWLGELGREEGGETGCKTKMIIIIIIRMNKTNINIILYIREYNIYT